MNAEEKLELITRDLQEVVGKDDLAAVLAERDVQIYWGTATTGKPHFAYFLPLLKLADFLEAGCGVTILIADIHGYLDNLKSDWDLLAKRTRWYTLIIRAVLDSVGVDTAKLRFVTGSDMELDPKYTMDVYRLSALNTVHDSQRASAEVVKQTDNPLMSNLLYPILQALDEEYLKVDAQFGGADQRKIFMFARENLPKIGYKKRAHLMNPLVPSLSSADGKMSASDANSKIDFDDSNAAIKKKIARAYSRDGEVDGNPLLSLMRHIGFRFLRRSGEKMVVVKAPKYGGQRFEFAGADELEAAFARGDVVSGDIKPVIASVVQRMCAPLQKVARDNARMLAEAYPDSDAAKAFFKAAAGGKKKGGALTPTSLRLVVGRIVAIARHPQADRLYLEQVDVGEAAPRTIVSGLVEAYPDPAQLEGALVVAATNLQPSELPRGSGVVSHGMLMCTKAADGLVRTLPVPDGARPGDGVAYGDLEGAPDSPTVSKARAGKIVKAMRTDAEGRATFDGKHVWAIAGKPVVSEFKNSDIS